MFLYYYIVYINSIEIQVHYERSFKENSNRYYPTESWPSVKEIEPIVNNNRNFLVLYRLLYYRHIFMKLSSSDPNLPALSTYVEAWFAYKEFFELIIAPECTLNLPSVWIYDIFYEYVYYHEKFMRRRMGGAVGSNTLGQEDEVVNDDDRPLNNYGTAASTLLHQQQQSNIRVSEEELSLVWQLSDVMRHLHRIIEVSETRNRLAVGAYINSFRDLAGYFALVVLCRTYTKLGDYNIAIEYANELGIYSNDALFLRTPKCHSSLALYAGFALAMSRRWEDALRVMSRSLALLQRSFRVLDDKDGGATGFLRAPVKRMMLLVAIGIAACPSVEIEDLVRRAVTSRHREIIDAVQAGTNTTSTTSTTTDSTVTPTTDVLDNAFAEAAPGFLTWYHEVPAPPATTNVTNADGTTTTTPVTTTTPNPLDVVLNTQRILFKAEIAQRTAGIATLRSYLRLYTSIDVSKLASFAGMSLDDTRAALTSMKIKGWIGDRPVGSTSSTTGMNNNNNANDGSATGVDALHFYLVGDIVEIEEYRPPYNASQWFVTNIERLSRILRDMSRTNDGSNMNQNNNNGYSNTGYNPNNQHINSPAQQQQRGGGTPQQGVRGSGNRPRF